MQSGRLREHAQYVTSLKIDFRPRLTAVASRILKSLMCAHTIVVASQTGKLVDFLGSYETPLERVVSSNIPSGSGKKDNEKSRKRLRKDHPARDVQEYEERVAAGSQERKDEEEEPYELVFVKDTSATTCYGCKGRVRDKPSLPPPPPHLTSSYGIMREEFIRRKVKSRSESPQVQSLSISIPPMLAVLACHGLL